MKLFTSVRKAEARRADYIIGPNALLFRRKKLIAGAVICRPAESAVPPP